MSRKVPMSPEERRLANCAAAARWRAKPGNREKHIAAVKKCRQRPHAKEKHRQRQLLYAAKNREQEKQRAAKWRKDHPDQEKMGRRSYYQRNSEMVKAATKEWRENNPKIVRDQRSRRKARERAAGDLPRGITMELFDAQKAHCNACRTDLSESGFHLDHLLAIARGGDNRRENLQLLCPSCNRRKHTKNFDVFVAQLRSEGAIL